MATTLLVYCNMYCTVLHSIHTVQYIGSSIIAHLSPLISHDLIFHHSSLITYHLVISNCIVHIICNGTVQPFKTTAPKHCYQKGVLLCHISIGKSRGGYVWFLVQILYIHTVPLNLYQITIDNVGPILVPRVLNSINPCLSVPFSYTQ